MSTSSARYPEGQTATYSATLKNDDGTAIVYDAAASATPRISTLTLTLTDGIAGSTINSRTGQNHLNTNDVTLDTGGALKWLIQQADTTLLSAVEAEPTTEHIAVFAGTYVDTDDNTKSFSHEHRLRIRNFSVLCTWDDVREQIGLEDEDQEYIEILIAGVVSRFESETGRKFTRRTWTEYFSPLRNQSILRVKHYPIDSVTSVAEDPDGTFVASDIIDADAYDAVSMGDKGVIRLRTRRFPAGTGTVRVIYTGGYRDPAAVPWDLRMAAIRQVAFMYQRRQQLGEKGINIDGKNVSLFAEDLLPDVKVTLANHTPRTVI